jgi:hypothetical protein
LGGEDSSQFADGIGNFLDRSAAKTQNEPLPGGLAQMGSRKRHQLQVLAGGALGNLAISHAFQSDGKMHARLSASNVGFKTQIFRNAVD